MKKILVIEPAGKLYGSEMVLWDILKNKQTEDIVYSVVLPPDSEFTHELNKINVQAIEILDIHRGIIRKIFSYLRLFWYVRKNNIDLLFINQAGILRSIAQIATRTQTPIVCQVSILEDCPWLNNLNESYYKPVKSFICNSNFIASQLKVPDRKKSTLYYGYHWRNIRPEVRTSETPFHIVLLGRISESKGHFLLVKAIRDLKSRGVTNLKVFFVGAAPSLEVDQQIRQEISTAGLEDYFVFRGFQRDIEKELSDKNLMVIPSLKEPFGRIFCESAEAGLPIITADSGGLGELSRKFNLGLRFEGNNHVDLASKIEYAMQNYQSVKREFEQQSTNMLNSLNMEKYIEVVETILKSALENKDSSCTWLGEKSQIDKATLLHS